MNQILLERGGLEGGFRGGDQGVAGPGGPLVSGFGPAVIRFGGVEVGKDSTS